jgi:serine/threonine protein phosphatase PrpC
MTDRYFGATDKGRVRQNNEDAFFAQPVLGGALLAACVIDGVGGYEGGEVAAHIAKETMLHYLSVPSGEVATMMQESMIAANDAIIAARNANAQLAGMACVVTLVLADETANIFHYVHVGDTRLYLFRDGSLVKVSKDQSFVGFLEDGGRLTEQEAMQHLKRNEIDKALGFDVQLRSQNDYFDKGSSPYLPGDMLLLCSDGLTDLVTAAEITEVLQSKATLKQKTTTLIQAANNKGGKDNITVVLMRHSRNPQKQRAVKPKTKTTKKKAAAKQTEPIVVPSPQQDEQAPNPKKQKKRLGWLIYLFPLIAIAAGFFLWYSKKHIDEQEKINASAIALQLQQQLNSAKDSLVWTAPLGALPVVMNDTLHIHQDSLLIKGNGLHLVADSSYQGAGIQLDTTNRYLLLKDMVFENFRIGILGMGSTVRLQNVQFLNCAVPVQYSSSVPVNTPADLIIKDSLFIWDTTMSR